MDIEGKKQRIVELWKGIEFDIKHRSLAFLWEHREELEELRVDATKLEDDVIRILERIPTLESDSDEYHKHTKDLIRLIRHIEPSEAWVQRIRMDLDHISKEIAKIREYLDRRWTLTPETKAKLGVIKEQLEEYLQIYLVLANALSQPEKQVFTEDFVQKRLMGILRKIKDILEGTLPAEEAKDIPNNMSVAFRSYTEILLDEIIKEYKHSPNYRTGNIFEDCRELGQWVRLLLDVSNMEIVLPVPGHEIDHRTTDHEPTGVPSRYPRGKVAYVKSPGYYWFREIYKRALVDISAGPPNERN